MGTCRYCGQRTRWFRSAHPACEEEDVYQRARSVRLHPDEATQELALSLPRAAAIIPAEQQPPKRNRKKPLTSRMPGTLDDLIAGIEAPDKIFLRQMAGLFNGSGESFKTLLRRAMIIAEGVDWRWPLLDEWERWCARKDVQFGMWPWRPDEEDEEPDEWLGQDDRLQILFHTIMTISGKEALIGRRVEILTTFDDCPVCTRHEGRQVRVSRETLMRLPPLHPGCRCTTVPVVDFEIS